MYPTTAITSFGPLQISSVYLSHHGILMNWMAVFQYRYHTYHQVMLGWQKFWIHIQLGSQMIPRKLKPLWRSQVLLRKLKTSWTRISLSNMLPQSITKPRRLGVLVNELQLARSRMTSTTPLQFLIFPEEPVILLMSSN